MARTSWTFAFGASFLEASKPGTESLLSVPFADLAHERGFDAGRPWAAVNPFENGMLRLSYGMSRFMYSSQLSTPNGEGSWIEYDYKA